MKIYVVIENWDNCEACEDYAENAKVIGLATTKDIAYRIIANRRKDLIIKAKNYEDCEVEIVEGDNYVKFSNNDRGRLFCSYSFDEDSFLWTIEEMDLIDS